MPGQNEAPNRDHPVQVGTSRVLPGVQGQASGCLLSYMQGGVDWESCWNGELLEDIVCFVNFKFCLNELVGLGRPVTLSI